MSFYCLTDIKRLFVCLLLNMIKYCLNRFDLIWEMLIQLWKCKMCTFTFVFRRYRHFGEVHCVQSHDCHLITTPGYLSVC